MPASGDTSTSFVLQDVSGLKGLACVVETHECARTLVALKSSWGGGRGGLNGRSVVVRGTAIPNIQAYPSLLRHPGLGNQFFYMTTISELALRDRGGHEGGGGGGGPWGTYGTPIIMNGSMLGGGQAGSGCQPDAYYPDGDPSFIPDLDHPVAPAYATGIFDVDGGGSFLSTCMP